MNTSRLITGLKVATLVLSTFVSSNIHAAMSPLVDDFQHDINNSLGVPRQHLSDTMAGGQTHTQIKFDAGKMQVVGEIVPLRGQPGWASSVLLLDSQGLPKDLSEYQGIRLKVKVNSGNLSISANSLEVTNFDYHAALVAVKPDGQFHEVKIPFSSMKRTWSEQTELDPKTINSLSLVAFAMQKSNFEFVFDEVSFY